MYQRNRNLVTRADGVLVNVARARGQLFVCASGCCCGRTEDGFAPVPADLYHEEWERRRLRNFVHLTIGGCLGPCGLANVALLLFDDRTLWFHSINSEPLILDLYDYIEAMLDADDYLAPPQSLAQLQFTASAWQERPDGEPLDDRRRWRGRDARPELMDACALRHGANGAEASDPGRIVADMQGVAAMPRKNGELVFQAPWEGRAFGMAAALHENQLYDWEEFRRRLIDRIAVAENTDEPFDYYTCWLGAFESVLAGRGILTDDEIVERTSEFEFGERDDVY